MHEALQHTSAYVSIRQNPSLTWLSIWINLKMLCAMQGGIRELKWPAACACPPPVSCGPSRRNSDTMRSADASIRQHTAAYVSIRQQTSAYASIRQHTSAYLSIPQHTSAYASIRQQTLAYASKRQHTSACVSLVVPIHIATTRPRSDTGVCVCE